MLWLVSMIFTLDYFILIRSGDHSMSRKVVFGILLVISVVSLALFLRAMLIKANKKIDQENSVTK